jgi:hypothetical protein
MGKETASPTSLMSTVSRTLAMLNTAPPAQAKPMERAEAREIDPVKDL